MPILPSHFDPVLARCERHQGQRELRRVPDANRVTEIVDSVAGTIEHTYDALDRLTEEVTPEGTVTYTYDDADRPATMTVAGQTAVWYTFDDADRLTGVTRGTAAVTVAHNNGDRRTSLTLPNGVVVEYAYDDDSQLTSLTYKQGGNNSRAPGKAVFTLAEEMTANE